LTDAEVAGDVLGAFELVEERDGIEAEGAVGVVFGGSSRAAWVTRSG
jgi:hypothetical protein